MICEHCGTVFCWDDADMILTGADPKRFCSKACKKSAGHKRSTRAYRDQYRTQVLLQVCKGRPKAGYATQEAALAASAQLQRIPPLHPYGCPCGRWHLTSDSR